MGGWNVRAGLERDAAELLGGVEFQRIARLLNAPIGYPRACGQRAQESLDLLAAQVPTPSTRVFGKEPTHPLRALRYGHVRSPSLPQDFNIPRGPTRRCVHRRGGPIVDLTHSRPPQIPDMRQVAPALQGVSTVFQTDSGPSGPAMFDVQ